MDDFIIVENVPITIKKKLSLVKTILKEFNITPDREIYTLFYKELDNLKTELRKYLERVDDPIDEIVRLMYSTISQTIQQFSNDKTTIRFLHNKELVGNFYEDDEFYGLVGDITYYYSSLYKVSLREILFKDIIPYDCNLFNILFYILSSLDSVNYSNFILLSIKTKIIKLKTY